MYDATAAPTSTDALPDDNDVVAAVVRAVADAENVSPVELSPLANVIDPDALAALVDSLPGTPDRAAGNVSFDYSGYLVTVDGNCDVAVESQSGQ